MRERITRKGPLLSIQMWLNTLYLKQLRKRYSKLKPVGKDMQMFPTI